MQESLAILPKNFGEQAHKAAQKKPEPKKFLPTQPGGLVTTNPQEEEYPYTFSDSLEYTRVKKAEQDAKRAAELESRDETRGFLISIEEHARCQKWQQAHQALERRTAVPSGFFLVTRAMLRWKFGQYAAALEDAENALQNYSAAKAGELASAFLCLARICLGSNLRDRVSECSKELRPLVQAWAAAERASAQNHSLNQGIFQPREEIRLTGADEILKGVEAHDGVYLAAPGIRVGYVLLKNSADERLPVVVHFHGPAETAAEYREPGIAQRCLDLDMHLLVIDYRGYGWSSGQPAADALLLDAEALVEKLGKILVEHGLLWPCPGGLVLSGRSIGAQVAIHLSALYPAVFRALIVESAVSISSSGDRLGKATERTSALEQWTAELDKVGLGVMRPVAADLWHLSAFEKIKNFGGRLLVVHGLADDTLPPEGSESLHAACVSKQKQLVLLEDASRDSMLGVDEFWSALRPFLLKVQLDNAVQPQDEQHYCAVCAEKAASKCGRCGSVWYCSRQHQAEHWKSHKASCRGKPLEAKAPVTEEACMVAVVAAELQEEADVDDLSRCLRSLALQQEAPASVPVSWYAYSEEVKGAARQAIREFAAQNEPLKVHNIEATSPRSRFELIAAAVDGLPSADAPESAWFAFPSTSELWHPSYSAGLLRLLRVEKPDKRNIAVRSTHFARPLRCADAAEDDAEPEAPASACGGSLGSRHQCCMSQDEVQSAFEASTAEIAQGSEVRLEDIVVRGQDLRAFLAGAPRELLRLDICWRRFIYKVTHAFGRRVLEFKPADGQWCRWVPLRQEGDSFDQNSTNEADERKGSELFQRTQKAAAFSTLQEAVQAIAALRHDVECRLIPWAGEKMSSKDLRGVVSESADAFLSRIGLDKLLGGRAWAREATTELGNAAVLKLVIRVVDEDTLP